jgi:hypothetical protein
MVTEKIDALSEAKTIIIRGGQLHLTLKTTRRSQPRMWHDCPAPKEGRDPNAMDISLLAGASSITTLEFEPPSGGFLFAYPSSNAHRLQPKIWRLPVAASA